MKTSNPGQAFHTVVCRQRCLQQTKAEALDSFGTDNEVTGHEGEGEGEGATDDTLHSTPSSPAHNTTRFDLEKMKGAAAAAVAVAGGGVFLR